jgi:hypothetical protein
VTPPLAVMTAQLCDSAGGPQDLIEVSSRRTKAMGVLLDTILAEFICSAHKRSCAVIMNYPSVNWVFNNLQN